jgi:adenylosuccinate lyase
MQFVRAHQSVVSPAAARVMKIFIELITKYAGTVQIGRTHGQHALPITVGFWLATILHRVLFNAKKMDEYAAGLVGKISGAVGAYNAQVGLGILEKCGQISFEERVLAKLGLKPAPISSQILPPEPLTYYLFSCVMLAAALAQFGRDCRHLMRTEIAELGEPFERGQVGSSTMAHKRNPINLENLEGTFLRTKHEFGKVMDTLISEHQRDLVGSSVARDFPIIVVNLVQQLNTLLRQNEQGIAFLARLTVDETNLRRNFQQSANVILAEPLYIALQMAGYSGDAHKLINEQAVQLAQTTNCQLIDAIQQLADSDAELRQALEHIPKAVLELMRQPERYTGLAQEKALAAAVVAEQYLKRII